MTRPIETADDLQRMTSTTLNLPNLDRAAHEVARRSLHLAMEKLFEARHLLIHANCPKTLERVRAAIRSGDGAMRHMNRRITRAEAAK